MKSLKKALVMAVCAVALTLGADKVAAQRGGGDPAQMREQRLGRLKTQLDVTDEAEWKVLETAIGKVFDAEQDLRSDAPRFGGGGGGGRRNRNNGNGDTNNADANAQPRQRRGGPGGTPAPEVEDLQKAVDEKASAEDIKAKLGKLRDSVKAKEAKLDSAREDLKKLLTARQEAVAVLNGLLK